MRNYGSNDVLFLAAFCNTRDLIEPAEGDLATLPERIARGHVERMLENGAADPYIALIRASTEIDIARRLLSRVRGESLAACARMIDGPDIRQRVDLLASMLTGVTFSRYVLAEGPIAEMAPDELVEYLIVPLSAIIFAGAELHS